MGIAPFLPPFANFFPPILVKIRVFFNDLFTDEISFRLRHRLNETNLMQSLGAVGSKNPHQPITLCIGSPPTFGSLKLLVFVFIAFTLTNPLLNSTCFPTVCLSVCVSLSL